MLRQAFYCGRINLARMLSDPKTYVILGVFLVFSYYAYYPFYQMASYYQVGVTPYLYVFFLSRPQTMALYGSLCILLFVEVPHSDGYANLILIRGGRLAYILGQILYILVAAFLFVTVGYIFSLLFVLPVTEWSTDWGKLLRNYMDFGSRMMQELGLSVSMISVDGAVVTLCSPVKALSITFLVRWLTAVSFGMIILCLRVYFTRNAGLIVTGILVALSVFAINWGMMAIGKWLQYAAPIAWCDISYLDWFYSGMLPSPTYGLTVLIGSSLLLGVLCVLRYCRRDLIEG